MPAYQISAAIGSMCIAFVGTWIGFGRTLTYAFPFFAFGVFLQAFTSSPIVFTVGICINGFYSVGSAPAACLSTVILPRKDADFYAPVAVAGVFLGGLLGVPFGSVIYEYIAPNAPWIIAGVCALVEFVYGWFLLSGEQNRLRTLQAVLPQDDTLHGKQSFLSALVIWCFDFS